MALPPAHFKETYLISSWFSGCTLILELRFTYMGHVISQSMSDNDDMKKHTTKLSLKVCCLGNSSARRSRWNFSRVTATLYCQSPWSRYRLASMDRVRVCYSNMFMRLPGLLRRKTHSCIHWHTRSCLNVLHRYTAYSVKSMLEQSENPVTTSIRHSCVCVEL